MLFAIQDHCEAEAGVAQLSLKDIKEMTQLSRRRIAKALAELDGRFLTRISGGPCTPSR